MTKYLIQDTTLTSIADEIRTLSGTEETLSPEAMKEKVAEGNENIAIQADLIAQIQAVVDSLPEAGSGGNDGTNAELITGTISLAPNNDTMDMSNMVYYTDLDGLHEDYMNIFPYTFNCIKNSIVHLEDFILKESSTGINTNPFTFGNSDDFTYKHYVIVENNNFNIIIT